MPLKWYLLPIPFLMACGHGDPERLYRESEQQWHRGESRKALEIAERGWQQWKSRPDSEWHWRFRLLEADLLAGEGAAAASRALLETKPDQPPTDEIRARYLALLGVARRDPALADRAFELAQQIGNSTLTVAIELKRASLDGYTERSEAYLRNAVRLGRTQSDRYLEALAVSSYGYQRMALARFDEAVPLLERGEALAREAGAGRVRERTLGNLGWCYSRLGDSDRALRVLTEAATLARQVGDDDYLHRWLNDIGGVYFRGRDYKRAITYYQSAADLARRMKNETWLTMALDNLAATSLEIGDLAAAGRFNSEAADLIRKNHNTASLLHSQINTGRIEEARHENDRAEASFHSVIESATRQRASFVLWEAEANLARLLRSTHRDGEADREYRAALATIETEWSKLGEDRHKVTFLAQLIRFYGDYIDFLASRGETARAAEVADSSRARVLSERLGEDVKPVQPRKSGALLLSYWIAPARSYLWVMGPKAVQQFILPREARIAEMVNQYAAAIESGHDPIERDNPAGRQLYDALVAPARDAIPAGASVILVPDGPLHRLNFETLVVSEPSPHYWIEDVTLAVAPALGVLQSPQRRQSGRLLFVGDPVPADPEFPPLPHLKREAETVRRSFPPASLTVLTREQAHPRAYQAANPGDYSLIHFAAHAVANAESPLDSAVILSRMGDDYKLYARDVMAHRLRAELVTISACRGAGAKSYAGEGLLGFTWAFLNAGARNVIAGLWEADDDATAELMDEFYARLSNGSNPATALRRAKLKLLKSGGRTRPPYYWASMSLFTRDSELGLSDRNLAAAGYAPKTDLVRARLQAGRRK